MDGKLWCSLQSTGRTRKQFIVVEFLILARTLDFGAQNVLGTEMTALIADTATAAAGVVTDMVMIDIENMIGTVGTAAAVAAAEAEALLGAAVKV